MENIAKNITLECARNRFQHNYMPALEYDTLSQIKNIECWGDFPYDVIIESGDTFDIFSLGGKLPMLCECGHYVFRFGNIAHIYAFLKRIARETEFYKLAFRQSNLKWIKIEQDFYSGDTLTLFSTLPNTETFSTSGSVCDIVGVHSEADIFNGYFRISGDTTRYEINFKRFVESIFGGSDDYKYQKPYLDLSLVITEDVHSVGEMLSDEQEWKPNKKYYLGDIVHYEDDYYVLEHGSGTDTVDVVGEMYDIVYNDFISGQTIYNFVKEIPSDLSELSTEKLNILYNETVTPTDFKVVYTFYKGDYDASTKLTSFDSGDGEHWSKIKPKETGEVPEEAENMVAASKLDVFRSVRKTYDLDNNVLPFNVIKNDNGELDVALIYSLGYTNYALKDNGACVDFLKEVTFMKDLNDESGYTITFDGSHRNIIVTDLVNDGYSYIKFVYYSGCAVITVNDEQTVDEETGVKYEETRNLSVVTGDYHYDGEQTTKFTYFEIGSLSEESKYGDPNKACARIMYNVKVVDSIPLHIFSNAKLFGSTFVEHGKDALKISRGRYGAFERHNILGEVNSMDDLKNYRNNYFKL